MFALFVLFVLYNDNANENPPCQQASSGSAPATLYNVNTSYIANENPDDDLSVSKPVAVLLQGLAWKMAKG